MSKSQGKTWAGERFGMQQGLRSPQRPISDRLGSKSPALNGRKSQEMDQAKSDGQERPAEYLSGGEVYPSAKMPVPLAGRSRERRPTPVVKKTKSEMTLVEPGNGNQPHLNRSIKRRT